MDEFQIEFIRSLKAENFIKPEESVAVLYKLYDMANEDYELELEDSMEHWRIRFKKIYGWEPPLEAIHYINDLFEEQNLANLGGMDLNRETSLLEYISSCDLTNFKRLDCFGESLAALFGIFPQGWRNYRDYELISLIDSGTGLSEVYYFEHEKISPLSRKGYSISEAYLRNILEEYEQDEAKSDDYSHALKQLIKEVRTQQEKQYEKVEKYYNPNFLIKRAFWLMNLKGQAGVSLEEVYIYNHVENAALLTDWYDEMHLMDTCPWLLNYWLFAHYYLGNRNALIDAIELSRHSAARMTQLIGKIVEKAMSGPKEEQTLTKSETAIDFCNPACLEKNEH